MTSLSACNESSTVCLESSEPSLVRNMYALENFRKCCSYPFIVWLLYAIRNALIVCNRCVCVYLSINTSYRLRHNVSKNILFCLF